MSATNTEPRKKLNSTWKVVAVGLISAAATGAGSWVTFGANRPSRVEVQGMIQENSPYLRDRALLISKLGEFSATLEKQSEAIAKLSVGQANLSGKIERALEKH